MKHFRLKVVLTVILAVFLVTVFSLIVTWLNYRKLSEEASKEKPLNREAVNYTLKNLSDAWEDYEQRIKNRYVVDAVFSSLALSNVSEDEISMEDGELENRAVVSIANGRLSAPDFLLDTLGLEASLFEGRSGCFAAPAEPSTLVVYSRIGDTDNYCVEWFEDTVLYDIVKETIDIPAILKRTEIAYDVDAMYLSYDPQKKEVSEISYKNDRYFSDCEKIEDLGLSQEDLQKNKNKASGTLKYDDINFSYAGGESTLPSGYVILLEPMPNLYAKAFGQAGYMITALIIILVTLLVAGFSIYPYVRENILTPEEEKTYQPAHVRSLAALFGVLGIIAIALTGMFIYALSGLYDDVIRGRERLAALDDSLSIYTTKVSQNKGTFEDIYLEFGNHIAEFLDRYPELRDPEVLSTLADSISASSITLYDADGRETVSSGPWIGLELGTDPESSTYDFRRILNGVPNIIHEPETDESTGLNEMRLGIRIHDDENESRYGVMMLNVDTSSLSNQGSNPEKAVREIFDNLSDPMTTLWISDAKTGRILVSGNQDLEGKDIQEIGLGEADLKGAMIKTVKTDEGSFLVTSASMNTPEGLEWADAPKEIIAYYQGPKTPYLSGMIALVVTGCVLFLGIYALLSWIIFRGYTQEFFDANRHIKGDEDKWKNRGRLLRSLAAISPGRRGVAAMEVVTGFFLLQMMAFVGTGSAAVRNSVYYYISVGDWEKGFNLFAVSAILILLSKTVLIVIGIRLLAAVCASFTGSRGKTIFRLISNIVLYVALFYFLIRACEYLGFSPTAIAAGMGSLALAISLGAQNFVADIFAGLTYVFEGTIHVGDAVEIAVIGSPVFEGKVVEIGVRCIKVLTREGDLITCGNRDIRMIKNSTQMNSRVICELVVSSELSADEIEQMLEKELPDIGKADRRILHGPTYNGISEISDGKMTLSVSAECSEEDYLYVRDKLNVSLQRIFREHGYNI